MSTTGWPIITTPIAGLDIILADTNNPTIGQVITHDGTKFVNTSVAKLTNPTTALLSMTATGTSSVPTGNFPIAFTNTSGTLTLNAGTYLFWAIGKTVITSAVNQTGLIQLLQTGGSGTSYVSNGLTRSWAPLYGSTSFANTIATNPSSITITTIPGISASNVKTIFYSEGTITVTGSPIFTLVGNTVGASALTISLDSGSRIQFIRIA